MHITFTNGLKKRRKIVQSSFYFLSIDDYERSISFLSESCNWIKFVHGSMKLDAAFPSTPNKLWVRNTSCQNCYRTSFKYETVCDGWRMLDLQQKRNLSILSSTEKAVEISEKEAAVVPDINDYVAVEYDRNVYIRKVLKIDD